MSHEKGIPRNEGYDQGYVQQQPGYGQQLGYDQQQPGYGQQPIQQQPQVNQPQSTTTVIVQSPQQPNYLGGRPWSSGLFSCFDDCGSCALGFFCPMILACMTASQMGENCCVPCIAGIIPMRVKTRMMFGIGGNICDDCCMACWCGTCILCQMSRELKMNGYN